VKLKRERNMNTTNWDILKDLYMTYNAILAGNWIGDLDVIEDKIYALCNKMGIDVADATAMIDDLIYGDIL
tara:strand:- start:92 stop:304 length:213 start_codon:yes stop_codon:yes gene_type:complete